MLGRLVGPTIFFRQQECASGIKLMGFEARKPCVLPHLRGEAGH